MSTYPTYKASGIEWLGDIPEHWELKRVKDIISEPLRYGANESADLYDENLPRYIRITDFGKDGKLKKDTFRSIPEEIANNYLLKEGDILFARSGATVGKTFQFKDYKGKSCFAGYLIKASPNEIICTSNFLYFVTQSNVYESWKNSVFIQATIQNISAEKYSVFKFMIPTIQEQTAIANYLDEKTSKLDQLISNKKTQIAQLKEIRQIEINTAVTKGLDPKVKLKPSGIEWTGDIPEHWEVKRIKDNVQLNLSSLGSDTDAELDIKYLDISNVNNTGLTGEIQELKFFEAPSRARRIVQNGDVVMSTVRPYLKAITYLDNIPENMIASTGFAVMTSKFNYNSKFLFYQTISDWFNETINSKSVGASYPALNSHVLEATKIMEPPLSEQIAIANYLEGKTSKIDQLVSNLENQIDHLQEVRKIEIYNAVTGKIKVA